MLKYIFFTLITLPTVAFANERQEDTCIYNFIDVNGFINVSKVLDLDALIKANSSRYFYIATIFIGQGNNRNVKIMESYDIGNKQIVAFDGSVSNFNPRLLSVDTSTIFNKIGDSKNLVYSAYSSGGSFDAETQIVIFKFGDKLIKGYSIEGCSVMEALNKIVKSYFIFSDEKYKSVFISLLNSRMLK